MDTRAFRTWAKLMAAVPTTLLEDAMIAATTIVHGLTVVTRNVRNFEALGPGVLSPFTAA